MKLRESSLPPGWYPGESDEISRFLSGYTPGTARAAIAPHAGWYYSGKIAAKAAASLDRKIDTLAIIGGHLPANFPPLFAMEDAVNTPLGAIAINSELRDALQKKLDGHEDRFHDNTVDVLTPMARFFFPEASLLWLRLAADMSSFEAGKALAAVAGELGCTVAVLASTDLTHYGPNYGFTPKGAGAEALRWVREINDRRFIDAVEANDPAAALEQAETDHASCSAGAVLGAMGFAAANSLPPARLLEYGTSADGTRADSARADMGSGAPLARTIPDSFVGYAAFVF